MKKYWKIEGREGLWVYDGETEIYRRFRQGDRALTLPLPSPDPHRPATFREIHGRAFPPQIWGEVNRFEYEEKHPHVVTVFYERLMKRWAVLTECEELQFPTHAEAIAYAQKHAEGNL